MPSAPISSPTNRLFVLGLVIPCLVLIVTAMMAYRAQRQQAESIHWVGHTLEVERELETLTALLLESESNQRGLLLGPRVGDVADFESSANAVAGQIDRVRALVSDNPQQAQNLARLQPLVAAKLDFMREVVALYRTGADDLAKAKVVTGRGKELMKPVLHEIDHMSREEVGLLELRQKKLGASLSFAAGVLSVLLLLNLVFIAGILLLSRRLARVQGIATVCAWSRTVEYEGQWLSFEEYLLRRFQVNTSHGLSPAELKKALKDVDGATGKTSGVADDSR